MHSIKREHFGANYPSESFPTVVSVSAEETAELRQKIAGRLQVAADDTLLLVKTLRSRSRLVEGARAEAEDFDLSAICWRERLRPASEVYVNWDRFNDIDRIAFADLSKHFDDIWYPASDDIDIFDTTCDWFVSVDPTGEVRLTRLHIPQPVAR